MGLQAWIQDQQRKSPSDISDYTIYYQFFSYFLRTRFNLSQKFQAKYVNTTTRMASWAILGRNSQIITPMVEPRRQQGIITSSSRQFTSEVLPFGCLLRMMLMKLGNAEPTTMACERAVDVVRSQLRAMTRSSILKSPIQDPQTLTRAAAIPMKRQIRMVQTESGKILLCPHIPPSQNCINSQSSSLKHDSRSISYKQDFRYQLYQRVMRSIERQNSFGNKFFNNQRYW